MVYMQCGACSKDIQVTRKAFRTAAVAPCPDPTCDGGVDLAHARAHADNN